MAKDPELKKMRHIPSLPELLINEDGTRIYHTIYKQDLKIHTIRSDRRIIKVIHLYSKQYRIKLLVYETWIGPRKSKIRFADKNVLNYHYKNLRPQQLSDGQIIQKKLKEVPGFTNLYINEDGSLVVKENLILEPHNISNSKKPLIVRIVENGKIIHASLHRLVAATFLEHKADQTQVIHIDGDRNNNHFSNLRYVNQKEKHQWQVQMGTFVALENRYEKGFADLTDIEIKEILFLLKRGIVQNKIAKKYNVCKKVIFKVKVKYMSEQEQTILKEKIKTGNFYIEPEVKNLVKMMIKSGKYTIYQIAKMCDLRIQIIYKLYNEFKKV